MLMPFFFTQLDHRSSSFPPRTRCKQHGVMWVLLLKTGGWGSEGTLMWGLGPSGRISLRSSQKPCCTDPFFVPV